MVKKRVLLLQSRDYEKAPFSGRKVIFKNYYRYLEGGGEFETMTVESPLNSRKVGVWFSFFIVFCMELFRGNFSMQSTLFLGKKVRREVKSKIEKGDYALVLVDSIRLASLIDGVDFSGRFVLDMDDLMSERYEQYVLTCDEMEFGILGARLSILKKILPSFILKRLFNREAVKLSGEEERCIHKYNKIIFTSPVELEKFRVKYGVEDGKLLTQIIPTEPVNENNISKGNVEDIVFGFIGSDEVIQNRKTIDYLLRLWKEKGISHRLIIAGRMQLNYQKTKNVSFLGYIESLSDFYEGIDLLVAPSFVKGGVKTKVLEAFSHGKLVLGNSVTFDGVPIDNDYPFVLDEKGITDFCTMRRSEIMNVLEEGSVYRATVLRRSSWEKYRFFASEVFD